MTTEVLKDGPDRIVVDEDGHAVSPRQAIDEYGVTPDVAFVRDDGWSLGAPKGLYSVAFSARPDRWVAIVEIDH